MTWSAPSDRTSSTLRVLVTPVTCASSALAIWTANVPIPPDAPLMRTRWPARTWPWSRTAWSATRPTIGTDARRLHLRVRAHEDEPPVRRDDRYDRDGGADARAVPGRRLSEHGRVHHRARDEAGLRLRGRVRVRPGRHPRCARARTG